MGLFMTPFHMLPGVLSGFHPMLGAALPFAAGYHGFPYPSPAVHRMPSPNVVTEDDFQKMIQIHRKRRLANEVISIDSVFTKQGNKLMSGVKEYKIFYKSLKSILKLIQKEVYLPKYTKAFLVFDSCNCYLYHSMYTGGTAPQEGPGIVDIFFEFIM